MHHFQTLNLNQPAMKPVIIFFTTLVCTIAATAAKRCFWSDGWIINVINEVDSIHQVQVHCKSRNDDIGMKSLGLHESVDWKFCDNIIEPSTLYFCHAYKGTQEQVFDVFNRNTINPISRLCREPDSNADHWRCSWLLKSDGIYIVDRTEGHGRYKEIKMHNWNNIPAAASFGLAYDDEHL
ncbi:S-protein homolog 6-like [Bidens hawaiensis]|uniref:S-protein homolog 6-like n=1 Tax=Bidens hawaiensis TaxID=980011 RepID=UPI0040490E27